MPQIVTSPTRSYLPFALLIITSLRLYILWVSEPSTRYKITKFDFILSLCVCVHVLAEIAPSESSTKLHRTGGEATYDDNSNAVLVPQNTSNQSRDPQIETVVAISAFITKRKAAAEVIAAAAILRLSWDPKDVCSAWYGWSHIFAGGFVGAAHLYMLERAGTSQLSVGGWIFCFVGMWIGFLM